MALPPAQPAYIFRGHSSQIHSTAFIRENTRLVTGDADGWIVIWSLETKRAAAVWRAHEGSILGVGAWGDERLITHGKDNKLIVWKLSNEDESSMDTTLPVDNPTAPRKQPWLLHLLEVNTMNFCSFAQCAPPVPEDSADSDELLVAVPNTMSSETVDIFHLPSAKRIHTIPASTIFKGGMIMALNIFYHPATGILTVIAGYENGQTSVTILPTPTIASPNPKWKTAYTTLAHTQPILSLSVSPCKGFYITSSADANIAKHPIPAPTLLEDDVEDVIRGDIGVPLKILKTGHAGQQSLRIRNDGKIFATAGWDGRVRVYGVKGMKEVAILKWHKEGVYAVDFADVEFDGGKGGNGVKNKDGLKNVNEDEDKKGKEIVRKIGSMTVKDERLHRAKTGHWVAAGSKDGKVSLWDIY